MNTIISLLLFTSALFNAFLTVNCTDGDNINFNINNIYTVKIPGTWFFGIYSIINMIAAAYIWTLNV